jgi:hypothetical protein
MNRIYVVLISVLGLALLTIGLVGGSNAAVRRGQVICKAVTIHGQERVSCPKAPLHGKRGAQGRRGKQGAAGPAGPAGPPGAPGASGSGSGLTLNFNAKLKPTASKELVIGNFTIREVAEPSGACNGIKLVSGSLESLVSIGPGGGFSGPIPSNESVDLVTTPTSNMFTAVTKDGTSTVSGIVGQVTSGGFCLVSGYVTGV